MLDFSSISPNQQLGIGLGLLSSSGGGNSDVSTLLQLLQMSGAFNKDKNNPQRPTNMQDPSFIPSPQPSTNMNGNPAIQPNQMGGDDLFQRLKQAAQQAFPNDPIGQQVAMTQAILESGMQNGKMSKLAQQNNFFGIKAPGTAGSVNMPTTEYANGMPQRVNASFGANQTPEDSFAQYRDLMNKPRYANVRSAQSPMEAFMALQRAGYATDPRYAQLLNQIYQQKVAPIFS